MEAVGAVRLLGKSARTNKIPDVQDDSWVTHIDTQGKSAQDLFADVLKRNLVLCNT